MSVAIAYYNLGAHLPDTLASLAAQTYPNVEVLVINDGSTDPYSRQVFAEQQALYPQFRFVSQDNAGIGATRNRGLAEARCFGVGRRLPRKSVGSHLSNRAVGSGELRRNFVGHLVLERPRVARHRIPIETLSPQIGTVFVVQ